MDRLNKDVAITKPYLENHIGEKQFQIFLKKLWYLPYEIMAMELLWVELG